MILFAYISSSLGITGLRAIRTYIMLMDSMKSKWYEKKETAIAMRKTGMSMTVIERKLGIARSTLSGWFRNVEITEEQRLRLMKSKQDGWAKARVRAVESHRAQKALRLLDAKKQAAATLSQIDITSPAILDLAFAMLYLGEGAKNGTTSLASSDPNILRFVIAVLRKNYDITPDLLRCDLHLRMDQDGERMKEHWASELKLPLENFRHVAYDKRSEGRATYDHYKGVCVLTCHRVAIQRKLMYLYKLFCDKVTEIETGA